MDARVTAHTVELFYRGQRVASHVRSPLLGRHTTDPAHMPKAHQHYAAWTPRRLIDWAEKSGAATAKLIEVILTTRAHPKPGLPLLPGYHAVG